MSRAFVSTARVRFAHCDAAGIVFYPRYFEIISALQEDWFDQALGAGYHALHLVRGIITPTVRIDCSFLRPSRLGEDLVLSWQVVKLGRSSVTCRVSAACDGEPRLRAEVVLVFADRQSGRSIAIPDDVRAAMAPFCLAEEETA